MGLPAAIFDIEKQQRGQEGERDTEEEATHPGVYIGSRVPRLKSTLAVQAARESSSAPPPGRLLSASDARVRAQPCHRAAFWEAYASARAFSSRATSS